MKDDEDISADEIIYNLNEVDDNLDTVLLK
jgi:hypothetical protein